MSSDHTKSNVPGASLDRQPPVSNSFNTAIDLDSQIASLTPEARAKCRMVQELTGERLEAEKKSQQRSHGYRVLRAKVEMLETYIRQPALRPPGIQADPSHDLQVINDQAERTVSEREAYHLRAIGHEADANIKQIIAKDRQSQSATRADAQHDEHGH